MMVYGYEKPSTRRSRTIGSIVTWAVLIPVFASLWMAAGWWTLIPVGLAAWGSWAYIKKGGVFEALDKQSHKLGGGLGGQ